MCMNMECIDREKCYRVQAIPNEYRQAYCNFPREKAKCEWFIPLYGKDNPLVNDKSFKCQREFEGESKCENQCEHCKEYYKPIE